MYVRNAHGNYSMNGCVLPNCNCCVYGCSSKASDRAHVRKCTAFGKLLSNTVFIVPMCEYHNRSKSDKPFRVKDSTDFFEIN